MLPALLSSLAQLTTLVTRLTEARTQNLDNLNATVSSRSTLTSAQAASAVWGAATRTLTSLTVTSIPSIIDTIQQVVGTLSVVSADVTINAVVTAKTIVVFAGSTGPSGSAMDFFPRAQLLNSTTLRITRGASSGGATNYTFFVVEFK